MSREAANRLYRDFHKYDYRSRTQAPRGFRIPRKVERAGKGVHVLYRSPKLDPITYQDDGPLNYIHKHKAGVNVYWCDGVSVGVPTVVTRAQELVCLGQCLGFMYRDDNGDEVEVQCNPLEVEWFAVPNPTRKCPKGHALLVVEKRQQVLAMVWGGKLRVEPRGIVG